MILYLCSRNRLVVMNEDKYIFSQLTASLDRRKFNNLVRKYQGNKYVKHFTCWTQLLAFMFGQLSNRECSTNPDQCCNHCVFLVAIIQHDMQPDRSTHEVLQILRFFLTDKTPLRDLYSKNKFNKVKDQVDALPGLFD